MKLRTKLFLAWSLLGLVLWTGTLIPVQRVIDSSFTQIAAEHFADARRSITACQAEQARRMEATAKLLMNIPELRALIAETVEEITPENATSLRERLAHLANVARVDLLAVADSQGQFIAMNPSECWNDLDDLNTFVSTSRPAAALVQTALRSSIAAQPPRGVWLYKNEFHLACGVPIRFDESSESEKPIADGLLVMIFDLDANDMGDIVRGSDGDISLLAEGKILTSTLPEHARPEIERRLRAVSATPNKLFPLLAAGRTTDCSVEPLIDPASGLPVGDLLLQVDLGEATQQRSTMNTAFAVILVTGMTIAAAASLGMSRAVTSPLSRLAEGVNRVAEGDLNTEVTVSGSNEFKSIGTSFNAMVSQLRHRRELERTVEISDAANKAKSQFLANISHELRTPLNGVVGMSELLLKTELNERQHRYADLVRSSAHVLNSLINDILDFSKCEAGKMEIEHIDCDVRTIVEDIIAMLSPRIHGKGLDIVCDVDRDVPPTLQGDPNRIRQVLMNLINNAVKFTEHGCVSISVSPESTGDADAVIRMCVADTGIGIPPDRIGRLFQSFSQVDASTTRKYGGTGLGLAICKQLVELMGGRIVVRSTLGVGSQFEFTLRMGLNPDQVVIPLDPSLQGERILLVEPSEPVRGSLLRTLQTWNVRTTVCATLDAATEQLRQAAEHGDAYMVILVGDLAEADGLEAGRRLRHEISGSTRTILLARPSPSIALPTAQQWKDAGFAACVSKPVCRTSLLHALLQSEPADSSDHKPEAAKQTSILSDARILLAEDNDVNQIVVKEMLSQAGYSCDLACDGAAASRMAAETEYDLILMDCQMPVMDGYEASERIRAVEGTSGRRPAAIIALTANASTQDRDRCLAAGMDAFCTKPIDGSKLIATIESCLQAAGGPRASRVSDTLPFEGAGSTQGIAAEADAIDFDAVLARCGSNQALTMMVLDKLMSQAHEAIAAFEKCIANDDAAGLARIAHTLKGSAGMAGASSLQQHAAKIESMGRESHLEEMSSLLEAVRTQTERCEEAIRHRRETMSGGQ